MRVVLLAPMQHRLQINNGVRCTHVILEFAGWRSFDSPHERHLKYTKISEYEKSCGQAGREYPVRFEDRICFL